MLHKNIQFAILLLVLVIVIPAQSRTTQSIVTCIRRIKSITIPQSLQSICLNDLKDKSCLKTVAGMNQCLLLNQCFNQPWKQEMNYHCWNCWADYTTESHLIQSFQEEIKRQCNSENKIASILALVALIFVALLY